MKRLFLFSIIFTAITFLSCSNTNEPERNAAELKFDDLKNTPGYSWFDVEYNKYTPDNNFTHKIDSVLRANPGRFYVYVNPSCNCTGTQKLFPSIVKVLKSSNVPDSMYKIFSMYKSSNHHPYQSWIHVNSLPSLFLFRDTNQIYSVLDTLNFLQQKNPGIIFSVEDIIYRVLTTN